MKKINFLTLVLIALSVMINSCHHEDAKNPDDKKAVTSDREVMLAFVADEIIVPRYEAFKVKMDNLVFKSEAFSVSPSTSTLADLRESWKNAYIEWQKVELFDVGPAESTGLRFYMNIYPTSVKDIKTNITSGNASLEGPASYASQGFPALDYLINGTGIADDSIVSFYTDAAESGKNKAYLVQVAKQMQSKFTAVYSSWKNGYRNTFVSNTALDLNSSTSLMVNGYVMNYERYIRSGKFGIPAGAMVGGVKNDTKVEGYYKKDLSKTLAQTAHQASIDFFNGKSLLTGNEGYSLKTYLNSLNAKDVDTGKLLSEVINEHFKKAADKIDLLNSDLSEEVRNNNEKMIDVYNELQLASGFLKVDMTSAMSITITYTDNDGD